ncbi:hypothetical protein SUGI_0624030 [Cryptomeria japonica]|nr:hypothetical protein SUGI_0624030 [Cryptomeria japonica]
MGMMAELGLRSDGRSRQFGITEGEGSKDTIIENGVPLLGHGRVRQVDTGEPSMVIDRFFIEVENLFETTGVLQQYTRVQELISNRSKKKLWRPKVPQSEPTAKKVCKNVDNLLVVSLPIENPEWKVSVQLLKDGAFFMTWNRDRPAFSRVRSWVDTHWGESRDPKGKGLDNNTLQYLLIDLTEANADGADKANSSPNKENAKVDKYDISNGVEKDRVQTFQQNNTASNNCDLHTEEGNVDTGLKDFRAPDNQDDSRQEDEGIDFQKVLKTMSEDPGLEGAHGSANTVMQIEGKGIQTVPEEYLA